MGGIKKATTFHKWLLTMCLAFAVCFFAFGKTEVKAAGYTGLAEYNGAWYLFQDDQVNYGYTGLYCDPNYGWWLVQDGRVAFEYNDLYGDPNYGWWLVSGGAVNFSYSDLFNSPTCGWWKINGGAVDFSYNDLYNSPTCGWWKVSGGAVDFGYADIYNSPTCGWWLVYGGSINFGYSDLFNSPTCGWWKINGGAVDFGYKDLYNSPTCGWWLVDNGALAFNYSDVWNSPQYGAWLVYGGGINFGYTGAFNSAQYGEVYVNGGAVDLSAVAPSDPVNPTYNWATTIGVDAYVPATPEAVPQENFGPEGNTAEMIAAAFPKPVVEKGYNLKKESDQYYGLYNSNGTRTTYSGLFVDANGDWWGVADGTVSVSFSGMYDTRSSSTANKGIWYIKNGKVDKNYTGLYTADNGLKYYFEGGQCISSDYLGAYKTKTNGWCYIYEGFVSTHTDLVKCGDGRHRYFENGVFDETFTGVVYPQEFAQNGTYFAKYVSNGVMSTTFTGIVKNSDGQWVYFKNGCDTAETRGYTGMAYDVASNVWRYFTYGKINTQFTGMALHTDGNWYYYKDGVCDFGYEGIGRCTKDGKYYTWYFKNGKIATDFTGTYKDGIVTYLVTNGRARAVDSETPLLGVFFNSRKDCTDTLYISFDGYEFLKIGEAYTDGFPQDENNDLSIHSPYYIKGGNSLVVNTIHDPCIRYYNGAYWVVGGFVQGNQYVPLIGYSTDLVNWSYPMPGTASNGVLNTGIVPATTPLAADGSRTNATGFDAVAQELFFDDNGDVYLTVSLGYYADNNTNKLSTYITKISNLKYPVSSNALTTMDGKLEYSSKITVDYGPLVEIGITGYDKFVYDCSLYKENGTYYYVANVDGEEVMVWSTNDLSKATDPKAWTRVNEAAVWGYEGPFINKYNGEYFMYIDRFTDWAEYRDAWDGQFFTFASTGDNLSEPFDNYVHIRTIDNNGKVIENRHGSVVTLTDPNAAAIAKRLFNSQYK